MHGPRSTSVLSALVFSTRRRLLVAYCPGGEMADAGRLNRPGRKTVRVRPPPRALLQFVANVNYAVPASLRAYASAWVSESVNAVPFQAMSKAVPWSTLVRMIGRPIVTFTPVSKASNFIGPWPWS